MRKKNLRFVLLFLVAWQGALFAQVAITPTSAPDGYFFVDDLWKVTLFNGTQQPVEGRLEVVLEDNNSQPVLINTIEAIKLRPGANTLGSGVFKPGAIQYGSSPSTATFRRTGKLPYGNYVLCYNFYAQQSGAALGTNCTEKTIQPFSPPELVSPYDGEELESSFPVLTWRPPFPPSDVQIAYSLRLVEVRDGQDSYQALRANAPMLEAKNLKTTFLTYPSGNKKLEVGRKYAWQVAASYNGFSLGETEVWVFEVVSSMAALPLATNICVPKTSLGGGYYAATGGVLKFFYNNQYQEGPLNFKVYKQGEWITPITPPGTGAWDLGPQPGKNVLSLSLTGVTGITTGNNYVLVAVDKKGRKYYVEFLYSS